MECAKKLAQDLGIEFKSLSYKSLGFDVEGIFMNDELSLDKNRHVVSMAIFKNKKNYSKRRKKIWDNI